MSPEIHAQTSAGSVVGVPLRRRDGSLRAVALIDEADGEAVLAYRWCLNGAGYAHRSVRLPNGRQTMLLLHRFLLGLAAGDPQRIDHIDRDPLNCRRSNLRLATHALNLQNRAASGNRGSSSRYRGVCWDRAHGMWLARVRVDNRTYHLGRFGSEDVAGAVAAAFRARHMPFASG